MLKSPRERIEDRIRSMSVQGGVLALDNLDEFIFVQHLELILKSRLEGHDTTTRESE